MGRPRKPRKLSEAETFYEASEALKRVQEFSAAHPVETTAMASLEPMPEPKGVPHGEPKRLAVIDGSDLVWNGLPIPGRFDGALVQIEPPPDADPAMVEEIAAQASKLGAERVNVLPWRRSSAVVDPSVRPEDYSPLTLRGVVERMIDDVPDDQEAVRAFCRPIMDQAGM